jgi:hypothetical protein
MKIHPCAQRSPEWFALRAGRPTASEFSKLVTSTGEISKTLATYALTLAGEMFAGKPLDGIEPTQWMERGQEMEAEAIRCYQFQCDADVDPVGFVTDDELRMGCSPDGLVGSDGGVEVKCLKASNHIGAILYHQKHGRCPPDYIQQVQGSLMITGRKFWDTVFYHPDLPLLVIRQVPDIKLHACLLNAITLVLTSRDEVLAALKKAGPSALETAA